VKDIERGLHADSIIKAGWRKRAVFAFQEEVIREGGGRGRSKYQGCRFVSLQNTINF